MKKAIVAVTLDSYKLDIDRIETMLGAVGAKLKKSGMHLRVVPYMPGSAIQIWADRQLSKIDNARISLYESKHYSGPVQRNNAAVLGNEAHMGKATYLIQLGPIEPHYQVTVKDRDGKPKLGDDGQPVKEWKTSSSEAFFEYWGRESAPHKPTLIQVLDDGEKPKVVVNPKKWVINGTDRTHLTPKPGQSGGGEALQERSTSFWDSF